VKRSSAIAGVLVALAAFGAAAQENKDLERIPEIVPAQPPGIEASAPKSRTTRSGRFYVEDALTLTARRGDLVVPAPPPVAPSWQNRTSVDALKQFDLGEGLSATLSDRFNMYLQDDVNFPSRRSIRNDFREGYVTWEPRTRNYVEAGRVNVRNGVALGFNPTDFFKARTLVDQASLDPSVIRQNRLGTVMARGQAIREGGSASLSVAPKLESPAPISTTAQPSLNPSFDRTNGTNRVLLTASYDIGDLNPQALLYNERGRTKFGLNLSHQIGQSVVGYLEWAGGKQPNLIAQAVSYGKLTGTLPPNAPTLPPADSAEKFRNDVAIGASWTSSTKITLNLEYHYHQAGLSNQDWKNWFDIGAANASRQPVTAELWYLRGFAGAQQQPLTRHQAFLRADWPDAFVVHLELTALAFVNLYDGSTLGQLSASYDVSDAWTLRAYISANLGAKRSERGSVPQAASAILQLVRYF
jgi:opacity protein-like surface antigen